MKNIKLGIFVVGTTIMLWLGCGSNTWDPGRAERVDYTFETVQDEEDSLASEAPRTIDELDE